MPAWGLTIAELVLAWLDHCRIYYGMSANTQSTEYSNCRHAIRPLVHSHGDLLIGNFTPDVLKEVRERIIAGGWKTEPMKRPAKSWSRSQANGAVNRIKRMLRWGVENNLVRPEVSAMIGAVAPLKKGCTIAREAKSVRPVDQAIVEATLPHLPPVVQAMVKVQMPPKCGATTSVRSAHEISTVRATSGYTCRPNTRTTTESRRWRWPSGRSARRPFSRI